MFMAALDDPVIPQRGNSILPLALRQEHKCLRRSEGRVRQIHRSHRGLIV